MTYVLDACAAAALFLPEEASARVEGLVGSLGDDDSILVPHLWWYETANILAGAVRHRRLAEADAVAAWNLMAALSPETDSRAGSLFGVDIMELALSHSLSAYDASYLELAMRKRAALVTLDRDLALAAGKAGVRLPLS